MQERQFISPAAIEQKEVSGVLRNTYGLLAMTLAFSGLVAYVSQQMRLPHVGPLLTLVGSAAVTLAVWAYIYSTRG